VSTPSDPRSGGQQPDEQSGAGAPADGPEQQGQQPTQPGQYPPPGQQYGQPGQYGQQPYAQPGQYPPPGQYGQPDQYGQPSQSGQQPAYGQPYNPYAQQGPPPYGAQPQYGQPQPGQYGGPPAYGQPGYNPYGQPGQYAGTPFGGEAAGMGSEETPRVSRPPLMIVSLVLLILSALPFLAAGAVMLAMPMGESAIPPGLEEQLEESGVTLDVVISALRGVAVVILVVAALYVLFAVMAFLGHNWARILLTIMTVGFTLLLLASMFTGAAADAGSLVFLLLVVAASVGGTVITFLPEPSRWFRTARS